MTRTNTGKSRVSGILRTPGTVGFRIGEVLFMSRIFFRGEFQNSLGTQENSFFLLPYQKYYHSVKFANNDFELELGLVPAFSHVSSSLHPKNEMAIKTAPEQQLNLTTPFDAIFPD